MTYLMLNYKLTCYGNLDDASEFNIGLLSVQTKESPSFKCYNFHQKDKSYINTTLKSSLVPLLHCKVSHFCTFR